MEGNSTCAEFILIKECLEGNRKSQKGLYDLYAPKLFPICLKYTKNQALAEDVLQEVFIKIFRNLHNYRQEGPFGGWVRRITVNTAIEYNRRHKKTVFVSIDEDDPFVSGQPSPLDKLYEEDVIKLTHRLSHGYKTVFTLYAVEGFSHKEIADQMEITENTSKSQFCRAKNILRKIIKEEQEQSEVAVA